ANISIAALYRIKSGNMIAPDLRKINELCKVLECEPGDLIKREDTSQLDMATQRELERQDIINELDKPEAASRRKSKDKPASAG
ncbi:MAG: helix-turn-helix domain-containing protein, partial [Aggregatilineales bacterium]